VNHTERNEVRGCKISTTNLEFIEKFQCTGEEFYNAMTVIEISTP
jgi:hypothetical protein